MNWKKVKLGEVLLHRESRFKPDDERIAGLKRIDKIDFSGKIYLSDSTSRTDMIVIKTGELVISGINVHKGAVAIYDGKEDITATIHYSSYKIKNEKLDLDFLKLFLKSPEFLDAIKEQVPGGIKTEIKPKHLLPLEVKLPHLSKQKDIVTSFVNFEKRRNSLINELSHQLDIVKKLRQQILQDAVQGKLVSQDADDEPAGILLEKIKAEKAQLIKEKKVKKDKPLSPIKAEEIPFGIPENWVWCRLGELIEFTKNLNIENKFSSDTLIHYVDIDAIDNQKYKIRESKLKAVSELSSRARRVLKKGFIIYSLVRPYLNNIAIVEDEKENYIGSTGFAVFKGLLTNNNYLKYLLLSDYIRQIYLKMLSGFNSPSITHEQFMSTPIPLPPLHEQHRIVAKVESLMRLCDELEASIRQNQSYTEQLLQAALRDALQEG